MNEQALCEPLAELVQWWDAGYVDQKAIEELGVIAERARDVLAGEAPRVTRFEAILVPFGRIATLHNVAVELSYQDDGRTLKVFLHDRKKSDARST
jgi:hypothetical protein